METQSSCITDNNNNNRNSNTTNNNVVVNSSSNDTVQLSCLYTKHKTQKRKVWHDGRLVCVKSRGLVSLKRVVDDNVITSSSSTLLDDSLDQMELIPRQVQAIIDLQQDSLETEKYLITVEGPYHVAPPNNKSTTTRPSSSGTSTKGLLGNGIIRSRKRLQKHNKNGLQKLMSKKFKKPAVYVPPNPNDPRTRNNDPKKNWMQKRNAPLQPGDLERRYYGNGVAASSSSVASYNNHQQQQPPQPQPQPQPHPPYQQYQNQYQNHHHQHQQQQQQQYNRNGQIHQIQNQYNNTSAFRPASSSSIVTSDNNTIPKGVVTTHKKSGLFQNPKNLEEESSDSTSSEEEEEEETNANTSQPNQFQFQNQNYNDNPNINSNVPHNAHTGHIHSSNNNGQFSNQYPQHSMNNNIPLGNNHNHMQPPHQNLNPPHNIPPPPIIINNNNPFVNPNNSNTEKDNDENDSNSSSSDGESDSSDSDSSSSDDSDGDGSSDEDEENHVEQFAIGQNRENVP